MTITYLQSVPGAPVAEKQTKDARPGLESLFNVASTRVWGAAYDMVSPVAMAVRQATRQSYRDDEPFPFLITEEHFKKLSDGVDPAYWDRFENVENEQSAQAVRAEALQLTKDRRILAEAGYGGVAATIGATFLDPAQLSIMLLTGASGTTKTTIDAARAARVASMAEQGLVLYTPRTLGFVGSVSVGSAEVSAFSQVASRAKSLGILGDTEIEYVVNAIRNGASAQQVRAATVAVMQQVIKKQPALAGGIEANAADEIARQIAIQITGRAGSSASAASSVASATATAAALKPHDWLRMALTNAVPQAAVSLYQAQQQPEDFATTDTASQFAGDFAFGAASSLTRGASVWRRAGAGALAQGSPTLALDAVISDKDGTEMMGAWALNSLLGGAFNAMNVGSKLSRDIDDAAKNTIKRVQAETARQQGVDLTVKGQKALEAPDYVGRFIEGEAADFDAPDLPPPPPPTGTPPAVDDSSVSVVGKNRSRVESEITDAFGKDATEILPVVDAYAKGWARSTGKTVDDYYAGLRVQKGGKPGEGALFSTMAWHGSPHKFDKFSLDAIGTGEGAQAYGHGLYFSSSEKVAKWYKDKLSDVDEISIGTSKIAYADRESFDRSTPQGYALYTIASSLGEKRTQLLRNTPDKLLSLIASEVRNSSKSVWNTTAEKQIRASAADIIDGIAKQASEPGYVKIEPGGRLFKVELAPDERDMLDWNVQLRDQSPNVIAAIEKMYGGEQFGGFHPTDTGQSVYDSISDSLGKGALDPFGNPGKFKDDKAASDALKAAGVRGIKYKGTTSDVTNYVIFDDADISVKEMFQKPGEGAAMGSFEVKASGQRVIRALTNPNASTLPHELGHDFLHNLPAMDPDLAERAAKALGAESHAKIGVEHHEKFARGFEAYLRSGKAPSAALKEAFEKFRQWLIDIYKTIKGSPLEGKMNNDLRAVFDEMLTRGDTADAKAATSNTPPADGAPKTKKGPSFGIGTAGADDPAFRQPKTRDNWKVGDFDATHADEENGFLSGLEKFSNKYLRLAPIARVMNSDIRELRYVASMFMTDPTKNYAGMAAQVDQARASFRKKYYPLYEKLETEARKANPSMTGEQFREEVTKTIRRINTLTVDPNNPIHKAALEHIRLRDELVDLAARHGVPWSYEMEVGPDGKKTPKPRFRSKEDSNYMPIMAKRAVIDAILSGKSEFGSLGSEKIRELVGEAVFKAMKMDLTDPDDVARARRASGLLADRWLSNVGTHNEAMAAAETRLFSLDDRAEVVEILKGAGVHSDNIEAILFGMGPKKQAEGKNPFKRRMPLDVTHGIEWVDGSGITKRLSIEDLLVNDAMVLTHRYADAVLSQSAFAEGMRVFAQKYDIAEPPQTIGDLMGYLGKATGRADDPNLERIRFAVNATLGGTPPEYFLKRRGKMFAASRALRNAQQLALLGNVTAGVQNFSNIAHVLGSAGWDTTIRLFPVLPEIAKATWNGKAPPAGIIRMVTDLGIGVHSITDRVMPYVSMEDGIAGQVGWMENATMKAAHFSHRASGQRWTTDLSEILAGASMSEKLFRAAQSGKPLGTKLLASLGIDSEMGERIASQIRKHGYGTDVKTGEFNLRKWDDLQAAATAQNSIIAFTRRVSWQPDVTELSGVMASEEMKLFFQMRRFGLTAYEHAFVPLAKRIGKNPMDMGAWSMFVQASIVGSLGYVVNSWIQSVGRPDANQYLKRKLAPEEVAKASFSRAIWSSLLPAVADTALLGLGKEAQFAGQRITLSDPGEGIAGIWNSNPTGDTLSAWARSTSGIGRTFHDPSYHFSVQDLRNIERGLFIPNTLNLRTWIERAAAAIGVPEKSTSSYN